VPSILDMHKISDGTKLTIEHAKQKNKPCLIIAINDAQRNDSHDAESFKNWIRKHNIQILNIAGPRESSYPGIGEAAASIFRSFILTLKESS
jgi:dethiobiotin synthetase